MNVNRFVKSQLKTIEMLESINHRFMADQSRTILRFKRVMFIANLKDLRRLCAVSAILNLSESAVTELFGLTRCNNYCKLYSNKGDNQ